MTSKKVNGAAFKEYDYDEHNRLQSTTFHVGNETQTYRPIYDKRADGVIYSDNAVVGVTLDGVFTSKASQDSHGRVTEKTLTMADGRALLSEGYGYLSTQLGFEKRLTTLVETLTRKVGNTVKDTLTYTYDNNGNITEVKNGSESLAKYAYDGMNQLVREDNKAFNKTYVFSYDTAGNILSKKEYAYTTGNLGAVIHTDTYTYASTGWKDRLTSFNGQSITYDALGNPTTYRGHALTWGKIRQLEKYDGHTFKYDASGVRIKKNDITYQLDGTQILQETRPTGTIRYYYDNGGVCGFKYGNVNYYYEKNRQGDITAIYDESGNLRAEYQYDAWGNQSIVTDIGGIGTLNPFRYRGYYYDTETGLYYLNSRYYNSAIGRFINEDSLASTGQGFLGYNMFAYCNNNPILFSDPSGHIIKLSGSVTEEEVAQYERAVGYIRATETGASLIKKLEDSSVVFTIIFIDDNNMRYEPSTGKIYFDPYSGLVMGDGTSVQSAALGLAHEMGHAAQHLDGELYGEQLTIENANVQKYETPIAKQLGEPVRRNYSDCVGVQRMNNSMHFKTTYHRPWWHYIAPWNWGKPSTVITEHNK